MSQSYSFPRSVRSRFSCFAPLYFISMFLLFSSFMLPCPGALAFDFEDAASIGAAYTTHLFFHEMGHQVVAEDVGADSPQMNFFTRKNGRFYPGLSTYQNNPKNRNCPMQWVVIG